MSTPVTVLMAVHNGLPFVRAAVESILAQEGVDLTFLILDDASTDDTLDYLQSLTDARIQLFHNEQNLGLTRTLNKGLALCTTPYVARMDADDVSLPGRLQAQIAFLDQHTDVLLLGCNVIFIDHQDRVLDTMDYPQDDLAVRERLAQKNAFMHGAVMFRQEAVMALGGYRPGFRDTQDYDLWLRLAECGKLANLSEMFYHQRRHPGTKSALKKPRQLAFCALARELAQIRAQQNDDTHQYKTQTAAIMAQYPETAFTKATKRRLLAAHLRSMGAHHLRQHRWGIGIRLLVRALLLNPFEPGLWRGLRTGFVKLFTRSKASLFNDHK